MHYITKIVMVLGVLGASFQAYSSDIRSTEAAVPKQFLSVSLTQEAFNEFASKIENNSTLKDNNVNTYSEYEDYLYRHYSAGCLGKPPFRTPDSYYKCKRRMTEQFIHDVDTVNSYLEHIFYHMGG